MNIVSGITPIEQGKIYTLAESGTAISQKSSRMALVSGEGTDINNNPALAKRAKRKVITQGLTLALIEVAKEKGDEIQVKKYWNAFHCQNKVITNNGKLHTKYCKNRFCTVCCAIRKADMINRYYPTIATWKDVHFVTLTVKSCKAAKLNEWMGRMLRAFEILHNRCKKRHQRGKGIKLVGIKSLECNYNPIKKTYNPHFHIIVPSNEIAVLLKREWINQWKPKDKNTYRYKFTSPDAQKISKVTSLEHSLIETIKYGSKVFTEPDLKKKNKVLPPIIYAYALYNILIAFQGKRIFDRFGFNLPPLAKKQVSQKLISDFEDWYFSRKNTDWINIETGECLTGYKKTPELNYLLNDCIDKKLC